MILDEAFAKRLQTFSDKHCRGKVARLDLLQDMMDVFNLKIRVRWGDGDDRQDHGSNQVGGR